MYQYDASTSVFIHGIEFEMDDIDVCISYNEKVKVLDLLSEYSCSELKIYNERMEYCYVRICNIKVHLMFPYYKTDFIEETRDIIHNGTLIHTKTIEFYRRHLDSDHPLAKKIDARLLELNNTVTY
jgi:hypothetical protein